MTYLISLKLSGEQFTGFVILKDTEDFYKSFIQDIINKDLLFDATDPKTEKSYVRFADREKITQLRGKGLKVEMTEYGTPYGSVS